jgi:hypothetical protein
VSYDLYAWKGPLPSSEDDAGRLLEGDESAFEPSEDLLRFYDELAERYPALEWDGADEPDGAPFTWGVTGERSNRIVGLNFTWSVPGEVIDEVVALARKLDLVLYDPQGPDFHSPAELLVEPIRRDPAVLRQALVGTLIGAAVLGVGIVLPVPVLDWILIAIGGFIVVMGVYSVVVWLRE